MCRLTATALLLVLVSVLLGYGEWRSFTLSPPLGPHRPSYFGFAAVDAFWDAPNDREVKTNYLDEVAGFTNVAQMSASIPEASLAHRLRRFQQAEVKAILHVEALLFDHLEDPSSPTGTRTVLLPDAQARWDTFLRVNGDLITLDRVAALYLMDEPAWNGLSQLEFSRAVATVNASLPHLPIMMVEAYSALDRMFVPEAIDWVGFDRYGTLDPARDRAWLADIAKVRAALSRKDQKLVLVAETFWLPAYGEMGYPPRSMGEVAYRYFAYATHHPDVIALIGYLWPGGLDAPDQLGARDLPTEVQQVYKRIGAATIDRYVGR
ncbi:hypothetical protein Trad_2465 [Truepera radiovictrix DSM 17093]|uniref:GH26 domain-containing protein n=2 Tax=Truepera TaxID=332248 RepID=D7CTB0_TRURR|nr:hypothetical protein Trad_2465 [Truepera radiovictrix DSM 17093]